MSSAHSEAPAQITAASDGSLGAEPRRAGSGACNSPTSDLTQRRLPRQTHCTARSTTTCAERFAIVLWTLRATRDIDRKRAFAQATKVWYNLAPHVRQPADFSLGTDYVDLVSGPIAGTKHRLTVGSRAGDRSC